MRNLGNNLVASVYESNLATLSNPTSSNSQPPPLPRRPNEGELNAQLRRAWVEAKWMKRAFVRSFVQPSVTVWLLDLYRSWLLQAHSRRASKAQHSPPGMPKTTASATPSSAPAAPGLSNSGCGSKIVRSHLPRLVDRRRFSTIVKGSTARAQVTIGEFSHVLSVIAP